MSFAVAGDAASRKKSPWTRLRTSISLLLLFSLTVSLTSLSNLNINPLALDDVRPIVASAVEIPDFPPPTSDNTLIVAICMGKIAYSPYVFLAERFLRSLRQRGNFIGTFLLLTDSEQAMQKYQESILSWDGNENSYNHTILTLARNEDLHPRHSDSGDKIKYGQARVSMKRFKTLPLEYVDRDPRLKDRIRYVLYLDVDNVITKDMQPLLDAIHAKIQREYPVLFNTTLHNYPQIPPTPPSFLSLWTDPGRDDQYQTGQIFVDRLLSRECLNAWRNTIDTIRRSSDQEMLMTMLSQPFDSHHCHILPLPTPRGEYFALGRPQMLRRAEIYPTIVHLTGMRVLSAGNDVQRKFLEKVLGLTDLTSRAELLYQNATWEAVTEPASTTGLKKDMKHY